MNTSTLRRDTSAVGQDVALDAPTRFSAPARESVSAGVVARQRAQRIGVLLVTITALVAPALVLDRVEAQDEVVTLISPAAVVPSSLADSSAGASADPAGPGEASPSASAVSSVPSPPPVPSLPTALGAPVATTAPVAPAPVTAASTQAAPGQTAPGQPAPVLGAPEQAAPAQNLPAQPAPAQNTPAQPAPAQNTPAQNTPAQNPTTQPPPSPAVSSSPPRPVQVAPQPAPPVSQPPLPAGLRLVMPVEPVGARLRSGTQTVATLTAELDDAKARGAVGVRAVVDIQWMCSSATCDFAPLAPVVSGAGSRGLIVYLHVNSMPSWLDSRGRWYGPTGETGRRWAALFAQLTGRFGTQVAGYEVWNEPNIVQYWHQGPSAAQYADLLKSVWQAVKPAQPDVQIIGGVLSNNDIGWMTKLDEELVKLGGNQQNRYYYDLLGVHPYTGNATSGYDPNLPVGTHQVDISTGPKDMTFKGLARLRDQVAQNEGIYRDVVIGEFGYTTFSGWYHVPEPRRSQYLRSAMTVAADWSWLRGFTVYSLAQDNPDGFSVLGSESHDILRVN